VSLEVVVDADLYYAGRSFRRGSRSRLLIAMVSALQEFVAKEVGVGSGNAMLMAGTGSILNSGSRWEI
jgi:hypothetical protein